jgi:hypothetical protein
MAGTRHICTGAWLWAIHCLDPTAELVVINWKWCAVSQQAPVFNFFCNGDCLGPVLDFLHEHHFSLRFLMVVVCVSSGSAEHIEWCKAVVLGFAYLRVRYACLCVVVLFGFLIWAFRWCVNTASCDADQGFAWEAHGFHAQVRVLHPRYAM